MAWARRILKTSEYYQKHKLPSQNLSLFCEQKLIELSKLFPLEGECLGFVAESDFSRLRTSFFYDKRPLLNTNPFGRMYSVPFDEAGTKVYMGQDKDFEPGYLHLCFTSKMFEKLPKFEFQDMTKREAGLAKLIFVFAKEARQNGKDMDWLLTNMARKFGRIS